MITISNIASFSFDLQCYIAIRKLGGMNNKRTLLFGYNKTEKLHASYNLRKILEGEDIQLSNTDVKALRDGKLHKICKKHALILGFKTVSSMLVSKTLKEFCKTYIGHSLKINRSDLNDRFKDNYINNLTSAGTKKNDMINIHNGLTLLNKIDGTIDKGFKFCSDQINNPAFMSTKFHHWKIVSRHLMKDGAEVIEFNVKGDLFYASDRMTACGELRSDNLLSYMRDNPNKNMDFLCLDPSSLVSMALTSQLCATELFSDNKITVRTFKTLLVNIHARS